MNHDDPPPTGWLLFLLVWALLLAAFFVGCGGNIGGGDPFDTALVFGICLAAFTAIVTSIGPDEDEGGHSCSICTGTCRFSPKPKAKKKL